MGTGHAVESLEATEGLLPDNPDDTGGSHHRPEFDEGAIPIEIIQAARKARDLPLGQRMKAVSDPMLGKPTLWDAAGEGVEPDTDPPARYDGYDCLTFVEEVLALALPADPLDAPRVRSALRYGDKPPRYDDRRHFMLAEWMPRNIEDGWFTDITSTLAETHLLSKDVTALTWRLWSKRKWFSLPDDLLPKGHWDLPVMSLDAAMLAAEKIPPGALVITVRQSRENSPIVVTHLGIAVPWTTEPIMRHATRMGDKRVRDERMVWYFDHLRWYTHWPVEGVSVLMPREEGPRMAVVNAAARSPGSEAEQR